MESSNAEKLIKKAEKLLSPGFFKALSTSPAERLEQAQEYYNEAAEIYKVNKNYDKAVECYNQIAFIQTQCGMSPIKTYDLIIALNEKLKKPENNLKILQEVTEYYRKANKYSLCADYELKKVPIYEKTNKNDAVIKCYNNAISFYQMDKEAKPYAIKEAKTKKADFAILNNMENLVDESKTIYEEIGTEFLGHPQRKIFAQDYFFKCVLCYLLYDDYITARAYYHKFCDADDNFNGSYVANFCEGMISALESVTDNFSNDEVVSFDDAENEFLRKIRNNGKIYTDWHKAVCGKIKAKYIVSLRESNRLMVADEDFK